jgi:hypothetical protein
LISGFSMPGRVEFTALILGGGSQAAVNISEVKIKGQHQHLDVVQQLADLSGGLVLGLEFSCHPHFSSLLDDLLADLVYASLDPGDRRGIRVVSSNLCRELSKKAVEGFGVGHGGKPSERRNAAPMAG